MSAVRYKIRLRIIGELIHQQNFPNHAGAKGRADNYYQKEDCDAILNLHRQNTWINPVFFMDQTKETYVSI